MKLRAIEAIRYGGLENRCLADLGEGLTIVLGPNESGKSTFTALTRHVLFGYPRGNATERGYAPEAGSRHARLVFGDDMGEWAIERVDGPHRGPVGVVTRQGGARPDLLADIVGGVSEQAFRVVFGFGIDELADIERGDSDEIVARLYAGASGLEVNPVDVGKALASAADALYAPRAQKPTVNALAAELRANRDALRTMENEAQAFAAEQAQLAELTRELEPLKVERDALELHVRALGRSHEKLTTALERVRAIGERLDAAMREQAALAKRIEATQLDDAVLAAEPALVAVLDETAVFRQHYDAAGVARAAADEVQHKLTAYAALPAQATDTPEVRAGVERWRDVLADARRDADASAKAAEQANARARELAAVTGASGGSTDSAGGGMRLPLTIGALVLGAAAAVAGGLLSQWIALAVGVVLAIAGVVGLFVRPARPAGSALGDEALRAQADARTQTTVAEQAAQRLARSQEEWRAWLAERFLDGEGDDPVAVRALIDRIAERDRLRAEFDRHSADARRENDAAEAWALRLVDAMRPFDPSAAQLVSPAAALELAGRARRTLDAARATADERRELERSAVVAARTADELAAELAEAQGTVAEAVSADELDAAEPVLALERTLDEATQRLDDLKARYEEHSGRVVEMRTRLDASGRDDRMAVARQQAEGLRSRAFAAADDYLTYVLAGRLLDRARARYEAERQPETVRNAARLFAAMTDGRYVDVRVPMDGSGITVIGADGDPKPTSKLSKGAAEQLYLALRVGLIASLGDMGRSLPVLMDDVIVNFDPERRLGAVKAIGELASLRQVVFFTCHPDTAEALSVAVPGATQIQIGRCAL